jgi:hypothetical protein
MKIWLQFISSLYMTCVRFYPTGFRLEFEDEMCDVFLAALTEIEDRPFRDVIAFLLREFRDLPKNLVVEYWSHLDEFMWGETSQRIQSNPFTNPDQVDRSNWMNDVDSSNALRMPSRRHQILSAIPIFLFGLGISLTSLIQGAPWYAMPTSRLILSIVLGLIPMAIIAMIGILALIHRIPDWGLTWVGSAFMGLIILIKTLAEELAEVGKRIVSEPVEIGIVIVLFIAGVALLVVVGMRGWQRGGLLSIGFSVTYTLTFLWAVTAAPFYLHALAVWAGPISLLLVGLTYLYVNSTQIARFMILIGVGVINYVCILFVNTVWHNQFPTRGGSFSVTGFSLFMLAFLICGPFMGVITKPIRHILRQA